jgi:hypothetical protein
VGRCGIADCDLVAEALDQGAGDPRRKGSDQTDPVRREPGREHRYRDDAAAGKTGHLCVLLHHLLVGQDVGSSELDDPGLGRGGERGTEGRDHVVHGDRLAPGSHPRRRDHHREDLGQVTKHLERDRPGADDHRRTELDDRRRTVGEDLPDLVPGAEVGGERRIVRRAEPAEIDDAGDPCGGGCITEVRCGGSISVRESGFTVHRVDQVERGVASFQRGFERCTVERVRLDDLDVCPPGMESEAGRIPGHAADVVSGVEECRNEAPADVPGGTGDENSHETDGRAVSG